MVSRPVSLWLQSYFALYCDCRNPIFWIQPHLLSVHCIFYNCHRFFLVVNLTTQTDLTWCTREMITTIFSRSNCIMFYIDTGLFFTSGICYWLIRRKNVIIAVENFGSLGGDGGANFTPENCRFPVTAEHCEFESHVPNKRKTTCALGIEKKNVSYVKMTIIKIVFLQTFFSSTLFLTKYIRKL